MGKPSIFSKDYQRKMRRRKIKIALSVIVVIMIAAAGAFALKGQFSGSLKKPASKVSEKTPPAESPKKEQTATVKEEGYDFKLSDGKSLKAVYEVNGSAKSFKYVSPKDSGVYYNINPSGNKMVVFDKSQQNIMLMDINGNVTDITNPSYTSSGGSVINKQDVLSGNSSFIWCDTPAFVDDNNIAYISQLPWLNKSTKYVWMVNAETKENTYVHGISGESIMFGSLGSKGLEINADNSILYLTADGATSQ